MKKWISRVAAMLLAVAAVGLIVQRLVPVKLERLLPEEFVPKQGRVLHIDWEDSEELTAQELQTLLDLLGDLEYRYNGRIPGGVMKGLMFHLILSDLEIPEQVNLFVTTQLNVVYLNDREYEMVGDTGPLLEFLEQLK